MRARQSAAASRAARLGVRSCEATDGNDLIPRPDSDGEGAGSAAQNGIERLERWNDAATMDPDEGGGEKLSSDEATMINHVGVTNVARRP